MRLATIQKIWWNISHTWFASVIGVFDFVSVAPACE